VETIKLPMCLSTDLPERPSVIPRKQRLAAPPCQPAGRFRPGFAVVVASDKLFYWLFQNQPDRILPLLPDLPADARGYRFSAPVLKEREYRLDGLFLPPPERPDLPALILVAQMAGKRFTAGSGPRARGRNQCLSSLVDILCDGTEECGRCEALEVLSNC